MTDKQMTELFMVMIHAWPNAEIFKGGIPMLGPTIQLWTTRTEDIDFWTGAHAVARLCDSNRFPPSIAEFRDQAARIKANIAAKVSMVFDEIKLAESIGEGAEDWYRRLPANCIEKATVDAMGGPEKLTQDNGLMWNYELYEKTYNRLLRQKYAVPLPPPSKAQLPEERSGA